jgi:hypothetical protein
MDETEDRPVMRSDLLAENNSLRAELTSVITAEGERTRRHFDMVAEQMRADFKGVVDKTNATSEKVDRLIARNAIEHAAFVDAIADHEVRQRVLEKMHEPPNPAKS